MSSVFLSTYSKKVVHQSLDVVEKTDSHFFMSSVSFGKSALVKSVGSTAGAFSGLVFNIGKER